MDEDILQTNRPAAIWWHLMRTFALIARETDRTLAQWGLTGPQLGVLDCVAAAGGRLPMSQIGERLLVTGPSITGVVDRLERDGLVTRERPADDRRVVLVCLTEAGRQTHARACETLLARITELMAFMQPEEHETLARQLERIHLHLKEGLSL